MIYLKKIVNNESDYTDSRAFLMPCRIEGMSEIVKENLLGPSEQKSFAYWKANIAQSRGPTSRSCFGRELETEAKEKPDLDSALGSN